MPHDPNPKTLPMELTLYQVDSTDGWAFEPAPPTRQWMDDFPHGFAYRCIPLLSGNQLGWVLRCPVGFSATFKTDDHQTGIQLMFDANPEHWKHRILGHFGRGVLTFSLPWLFRTPPGYGLLVRGMNNFVKPGAQALDAFIETDWAFSTFTMNWRLLYRDRTVRFEQGDPVCQVLPYPKDLPEQFTLQQAPLASNAELQADYQKWSQSRREFIDRKDRSPTEWQKQYLHGTEKQGQEQSPKTKWELGRL